ncbi:MAG TPA: TetR/AcrR family transcriptional regulator [Polyangiales bacterium]|nr:TetR/AcrR family transcriptional regulator [Polyangiales bacterium]
MPKLSQTALEDRRQHILAAAARCFEREGFHRTTIADVRREAKVSTGAVYTYFPNKESIIQAMLEDAQAARRAVLRQSVRGPDGAVPAMHVLLQWVASVFTPEGLHVARVDMNLWSESVRNPAVARLAKAAVREATRAVTDVISAQASNVQLPRGVDSNDVAAILVSILLGLEVQAAVGIRLEPSAVVKALLALLAAKNPPELDRDKALRARKRFRTHVKSPRSAR